jgi:hypothetical protein
LGVTIAASWWTRWCQRWNDVSPSGALLEVLVVQLDSALIAPGESVSRAMACCCRNVRKKIMKWSGKCWSLNSELQVEME